MRPYLGGAWRKVKESNPPRSPEGLVFKTSCRPHGPTFHRGPPGIRTPNTPGLSREPLPVGLEGHTLRGIRTPNPLILNQVPLPLGYQGISSGQDSNLDQQGL